MPARDPREIARDRTLGLRLLLRYVDDPRNTDHAWMETVAMHFHCTPEMAALLENVGLRAGDDAAAVQWLEVGDHVEQYTKLYANHKEFVDKVILTHGSQTPDRRASPDPNQQRVDRISSTSGASRASERE